MFYSNYLKKKIKKESDPIRLMYLNEIKLKWDKLQNFMNKDSVEKDIKQLTYALNDLTFTLNNPKYTRQTNTGFSTKSKLFSPLYFYDIIDLFLRELDFLDKPGLEWGTQSFNMEVSFNPFEYYSNAKVKKVIESDHSQDYLALVQKISLNTKLKGSNRYNKFNLTIPLIIFDMHRVYREKNLLKFAYYSKYAKNLNKYCSCIAIGEMMDNQFHPNISESPIDALFILRKKYLGEKKHRNFESSVLLKIREIVHNTLKNTKNNQTNFRNTGYVI